jgi:hypothetical protein
MCATATYTFDITPVVALYHPRPMDNIPPYVPRRDVAPRCHRRRHNGREVRLPRPIEPEQAQRLDGVRLVLGHERVRVTCGPRSREKQMCDLHLPLG